jgi:Lrp/AsnC family transcriptional regulator, regulator for asnA, asnC and gidA
MPISSSNRLDDLDFSILDQLQDDGRRSFREIGKRLGVAPATVRTRLPQLVGEGVVEIVAVPNPWKLGVGYFAVVALRIDPDRVDDAATVMAARDESSWVGIAVSGCELMCEVAVASPQDFAEYREQVLAKLPGYRDLEVFFMADVRKVRYRLHRPAAPTQIASVHEIQTTKENPR